MNHFTRAVLGAASIVALVACAATPAEAPAERAAAPAYDAAKLDAVVADARREADRSRDTWRKPTETLAFFEVAPNETVVEALPGGGWFTRVILPYVTPEGRYIAANYPMDVFERIFGDGLTDDRRVALMAWDRAFLTEGAKNGPEGAVVASTFRFGAAPADLAGSVDTILYIRALHNLARFDRLDATAQEAFTLVKPGGVVGVVQHRAKADAPADYVDGSKGYLKEADVIAAFERAGFTLEARSEMHANPADTADYERGVWTLPPAFALGEVDKAKYEAIGESDRMTLRFRKPAA